MLAVLIAALSVHEAAHAWASNRLGDPTARQLGRLTLNPLSHIDWIGTVLFPVLALTSNFPLLGWAKPVPVNMARLRHPRRDFALVAVAGPASNLAMAVVGALIANSLLSAPDTLTSDSGTFTYYLLREFVGLNVLLAVFNMLPVPPLDGGNVLAGLVPESVARVMDMVRPWWFLILYALLFSGALSTYVWPISNAVVRILL
jgi:Zn-dependent protease